MALTEERKEEIYLELSKSATLRDPSYWLQILFAAGIATLGLALEEGLGGHFSIAIELVDEIPDAPNGKLQYLVPLARI